MKFVDINYSKLRPLLSYISLGCLGGFILFLVCYIFVLNQATYYSHVFLGLTSQGLLNPADNRAKNEWIRHYLISPSAAREVARISQDDGTIEVVKGRQYGGDGALSSKLVGDATLLEIMVVHRDRELAKKAAVAAAEAAKKAAEMRLAMVLKAQETILTKKNKLFLNANESKRKDLSPELSVSGEENISLLTKPEVVSLGVYRKSYFSLFSIFWLMTLGGGMLGGVFGLMHDVSRRN